MSWEVKKILLNKLTDEQLAGIMKSLDFTQVVAGIVIEADNFGFQTFETVLRHRRGIFRRNLLKILKPEFIERIIKIHRHKPETLSTPVGSIWISHHYILSELIDELIQMDQWEYLTDHEYFKDYEPFQEQMAKFYPRHCRKVFSDNEKFKSKYQFEILDHKIGKKRGNRS